MTSTPNSVRIVFGTLLLVVPALFACAAIPRLIFGLRTEATYRLVMSATFGKSVPVDSARAAAEAFARAPSDDGGDRAMAAEFLALGALGDPATLARSFRIVSESLAHAPANPRAWTLLCELEANRSPARAVACLDASFTIGRYDWFTAGRRMRLVAFEWPYLDERLRDQAASLVIPMWNTWPQWTESVTLRKVLYELTRSDAGRQLLRAGLISEPETLRSFNRFVIKERMNGD